MLKLMALPIELLRIALYALRGLGDALRGRNRLRFEFIELERLSIAGGAALALASIATFAVYVFVLDYTGAAPVMRAASGLTAFR